MSRSSKDANEARKSGSKVREGGHSKSLVRGLQILRCFTAEEPVLGISELADQLHESRSTTHRYATTLVSLGHLEQDTSRKYHLGSPAADVGLAIIGSMPIYRHAQPLLRELRVQSNYTVNLGILDGDEVLYLASLPGSRPGQPAVDHNLRTGSRGPLYCTAIGKAMLAALPDSQQNTLVAQLKLSKRAPNTITSKKALRETLAEISSEGLAQLAVEDEESAPGIQAIAAPIISVEREVLGGIELLAPRSVSTFDQLRSAHGEELLDTARRLSVGLDFINAAAS